MAEKFTKKSIKFLVLVFSMLVFVLTVIILIFGAIKNHNTFKEEIITQTKKQLELLAFSEARALEEKLDNILNDMQSMTQTPTILKLAKDKTTIYEVEDYKPGCAFCKSHKDMVGSFYRLDPNGICLGRRPLIKDRIGSDLSNKPGVAHVIGHHEPILSFETLNSGRRALSICVPIMDKDENKKEKLTGIIRSIIYLETFNTRMNYITYDGKGHSWLTDSERKVICDKHKEHIGLGHKEHMKAEDKIMINMLFKEASINILNQEWNLGVGLAYSDIAGPINNNAKNTSAGLGFVLILFGGMGYGFHIMQKRKAILEAEIEHTEAVEKAFNTTNTVLEAIPCGVIIIDRNKKVRSVNNKALQILGKKKETIVGHICHKNICPVQVDNCPLLDLGKTIDNSEKIALGLNEKQIPILKTVIPISLNEEEVLLEVFIDITDRKKYEIALQKALLKTKEADRLKSEFLANMSHEIRTPMNGIIGMTDLVLDTELTKVQKEYLNMISRSADSLLTILNEILDFSKMESGKFEITENDFDMQNTVDAVIDTLALKAHNKGIELIFFIKPDVPTALIGDFGRLRQIILNLGDNALKFTEEGQIVIYCEVESKDQESVLLHFSVSDTGIGIPHNRLSVIFESFKQADGSTTRKYGGTGLGLSISKQLSELMGGKIWVESELGKGSTFHFTVRFHLQSEKSQIQNEYIDADFKDIRVLIVQNNDISRCILQEMLTNWGFLANEVQDGESALAEMEKAVGDNNSYQLILADLLMPGMGGLELSIKINKNPKYKGTQIIIITTVDQREETSLYKELGISAYFPKPIKQFILFNTLIKVLKPNKYTPLLDRGTTAVRQSEEKYQDTLNILLVEDDLINQTVAIGILKKCNHTVYIAENGQEALKILEKESFDLVLMDVHMPIMDGLETTKNIREREKGSNKHLPIIAMTALTMKGDDEICLQAGMDGYLTKPFKIEELQNEIKRLIPCSDSVTNSTDQKENIAEYGQILEAPEAFKNLGGDIETCSIQIEQTEPIDMEELCDLLNGNEDLLKECFSLFLDNFKKLLNDISMAIDKGDASNLDEAAHRFKGSLLSLAATKAAGMAYELESMGVEGNLSLAPDTFAALSKECERIRDFMVTYK